MVVVIYRTCLKLSQENPCGIRLISIISRQPTGFIPRRWLDVHERCVRENQADFLSGWELINNILLLVIDVKTSLYFIAIISSIFSIGSNVQSIQPYTSVGLPGAEGWTKNSFLFSTRCMRTVGAEFLLIAIFY